jgi:WD40 repeat protein
VRAFLIRQSTAAIKGFAEGREFARCETPSVGGIDQTVRIWDVEHRQELMTLPGHRGSAMTVAFSPTGDMLASGARP